MTDTPDIIYTKVDEAPERASASLLPIIQRFAKAAGVSVGTKDISLAGRILATFPEHLSEDQRISDDLVDGMVRMMNQEVEIGPVNIGNPNEFTILELAETIIGLTGSRSKITHQPLPMDDPKQRQPDIGKAKKILKWQPKVSLEKGLKRTIDYFDKLLSEEW